MNARTKSQIENQLKIAKTDAENYLAFQSDLMSYESFVELYLENNSTALGFDSEWSEEWILEQKENNLPNTSSGSTFSALTDFDNIITPHFEDDDEAIEYALEMYEELIQPIVRLVRNH